MLTGALAKVAGGQRLRIQASTWNAMIDAAAAHRRGEAVGPRPADLIGSQDVVHIRNGSPDTVERLGILAVDDLAIQAVDNPEQFARRPVFQGVAPELRHVGLAVVCVEPAPAGRVVRAVASGVTPAMVRVVDEQHRFADIDPDNAGRLRTWRRGGAQILWIEPEADRSGDLARAVVRLGAASVRSIKARVRSASEISANRWRYSWDEASWNGTRWVEISGGASSDTWGYAYNGLENENSGSGVQGTGLDVDNLPSGWSLQPIHEGAAIEISGPDIASSNEPSWHFDVASSEDGVCA